MNSFAERLAEAIQLRGISQAELARRTGIGRNSISDYLKGKYEAKQDYLSQLAKSLDVNEAWLMGLDVSMNKSEISTIYEKLTPIRQDKVLSFAKNQLKAQEGKTLPIVDLEEIGTIAAHSEDRNRKYSPEELQALKDFADGEIAKFKKKNQLD